MTLADIQTMLTSVAGFSGSTVVYESFPVGEAPPLPFICWLETETDNFAADGVVYSETHRIDIELYAKARDLISEGNIEAKLNEYGIFWDKEVDYLDSEKCFMTTYSITI